MDGILFNKDMTNLIIYSASSNIYSDYTIPDGVTKITIQSFYGSHLEKVTIPDRVTEIGQESFLKFLQLKKLL